ncbi:hypothetical protein QVD17_06641 [Tagetes erecta]|uniref:Uncharacterized protein n=1 Tax=Tagetes erecta TaxID=13708 RepID=A0AAD8PBZ4_TARER|nr:hypothetical protein QVD17_06641 [Tagetes erecta]
MNPCICTLCYTFAGFSNFKRISFFKSNNNLFYFILFYLVDFSLAIRTLVSERDGGGGGVAITKGRCCR